MQLLTLVTAVAASIMSSSQLTHAAASQSSSSCQAPNAEVPSIRSYFYVGGDYVDDGSGKDEHIFQSQMYVEKLLPVGGVTQKYPIVLIHGQGQTGTNWLNTPDGRRGWASSFIAAGHEIYIVDQTYRARSSTGKARLKTYSAERIESRFTAAAKHNLWPQAELHTQWPGPGTIGDPIFDQFYASNVAFLPNDTVQQRTMQDAGAKLLDRIGRPVILLGHSQGGMLPPLITDARPDLVQAMVLIEPSGPLFREVVFANATTRKWGLVDVPMTFEPEMTDPIEDLAPEQQGVDTPEKVACVLQGESTSPARKLVNLVSKPILVVTSESSYHVIYDHCAVEFLKQAGCTKSEHLYLADIGIKGNGHMLFLEKNNHDIYKALQQWIDKV